MLLVEMSRSPLRALTHVQCFVIHKRLPVEMSRSPLRALINEKGFKKVV